MASAILFLEDHDQSTIWEDIEFATSLNPDYLQFMQLGPIPGTTLYKNYEKAGKILADRPLRTQHGQKNIWFHHEHFTPDESDAFLKNDDERRKIAQAGMEKAHKEFNCRRVAQFMLDIIEKGTYDAPYAVILK